METNWGEINAVTFIQHSVEKKSSPNIVKDNIYLDRMNTNYARLNISLTNAAVSIKRDCSISKSLFFPNTHILSDSKITVGGLNPDMIYYMCIEGVDNNIWNISEFTALHLSDSYVHGISPNQMCVC